MSLSADEYALMLPLTPALAGGFLIRKARVAWQLNLSVPLLSFLGEAFALGATMCNLIVDLDTPLPVDHSIQARESNRVRAYINLSYGARGVLGSNPAEHGVGIVAAMM